MMNGACLCGDIRFKIHGEPSSASHCHCTMCQKQHGAAYASYVNVNVDDLEYLSGSDKLGIYLSSAKIQRRFCRRCGSNIEWRDLEREPGITGIALGVINEVPELGHIRDIYTDTRAKWAAKNP